MSEGRVSDDQPVRLNYVIPNELASMLNRHCSQTLVQPSKLVRSLIAAFVEGSVDLSDGPLEHPRGLRTTVMLPGRLLAAFETKVTDRNYGTKAATIAGLLNDYLPPRTDNRDAVRVEISIPTDHFTQIYERFGPGPVEDVVLRALINTMQGRAAEEFTKEAR